MVRSADQKMNINGQRVTHGSKEEGPCHNTQGHVGKHQGQAGGIGSRRKGWIEPALWFLQEGMGESVQAGLGLACLSNFSGHWGEGSVSNCPESGSGVIREGK